MHIPVAATRAWSLSHVSCEAQSLVRDAEIIVELSETWIAPSSFSQMPRRLGEKEVETRLGGALFCAFLAWADRPDASASRAPPLLGAQRHLIR